MKQRHKLCQASLGAWSGGGGGGGGGSSPTRAGPAHWPTLGLPVSLRDAWAEPEQVSALQLTREGVIDPADLGGRCPPPRTAARRLWLSEPWVRHALAVQELLAPLAFSVPSSDTWMAQEVGLGFRGQAPFIRMLRPAPALFESELAQVLSYADLRHERSSEILSQIDGQWAHWSSILPIRPDRTPHTLALLTVALQWVITIELRFKHEFGCPRPMEWSPHVQPCITTPGHGSFPMGHAVQAFLIASVLQALSGTCADDAWGRQLSRTAFRISINRVVAGLHFPVDLVAGLVLGQTLGHYVHRMAEPRAHVQPWADVVFNPDHYQSLGPLGGLQCGVDVMRAFRMTHDSVSRMSASLEPLSHAPAWTELWRAAALEWQEVLHVA